MEVKLWYEKRERGSRIRAVQMNNLRAMIKVRRNDRKENNKIRGGWCLQMSTMKRMEENRIVRTMLQSEQTSVKRASRQRKRWIDSVREMLGLTVELAEDIIYNRIA